jgi:formylglycine-generating enzyme required for sulfatase activity
VLIKAGELMQMLDLELDEPRYGEVRVKMVASGVCHSCLHAYDGSHSTTPTPIVLGDEGSGVVEAVGEIERELDGAPGKANPESLWERHGQPGELAVDSVSWYQGREWLGRLNRWLKEQWPALGGIDEAPQLALPSENQWEGACRAGAATPFHFGDTLDGSWARYDASYTFGRGRKGSKPKQPWLNGSSGLVNRWGLAELHGQLYEWCEDSWHPNPLGQGHPEDGDPWHAEDEELMRRQSGQRDWKLLRGGSWLNEPLDCRAAFRDSSHPELDGTRNGLRPCCPTSPGSPLGA